MYHGHDGGVEGGLTNMAYMPDYGIGYFFSINSGNGAAFDKIAQSNPRLHHQYIAEARGSPGSIVTSQRQRLCGMVRAESPRVQLTQFIERITGLTWLQVKTGHLGC